MTSEANHPEPSTHHSTPAGGIISVQHVENSTKPTEEVPPHKPKDTNMAPKPEEAPEQTITLSPEQQQPQQDEPEDHGPPMLVVTEAGGPSESTKLAEDAGDSASVVSLPAAVPSTGTGNSPRESSSSALNVSPDADADAATVASAPAVVVETDSGIGQMELDDIMASPHGNNAIVERSPGGRYVRFMEKLGSGASKDVYRAYDTQEGIEVAWNVVHLAGVPKNERNRIVNEVRLLERLHHHNIISFHGSWINREKQQVNFVTEILSSGTLQSFINKVQVIRWKIAKRWALQILQGLEYLHSQEPPVIHRDLKCENIFINGTSGDLRIGDLGLSTVHRNGKALSVLGTPEFMAPDMYEESAYDEKVDIYAFGMCLLEIFTKEIPYRECNNPAQIYKKVTRGDPPDSLKRLKSRHAREFINMCLGTKDEDGRYIRPSATELVAHPFLQQRPSDDDEVELIQPMNETTIKEVPETSSTGAKGISKSTRSQSSKPVENTKTTTGSSPRNKMEPSGPSTNSLEDESDKFAEMPDSETSFRKPKVLMGRGQELQRDENDVPVQIHERSGSGGLEGEGEAQAVPQGAASAPRGQGGKAPSQSPTSAFHFLVAAAVIEDEYATSRPYDDDVLKLVVTLPVEGQTQNVQFDFHLVQDDPIQVAKEMVAELGIPQAAVLEISETISGLARAARVKQDKYMARMKNLSGHNRSRSESHSTFSQGVGSEMVHGQTIGHGTNMIQSQSHQSMSDYVVGQPMPGQHGNQQPQQQQGVPTQDQSPHLHGQQMAHHASVPQMHMPPQHQTSGDSMGALPLNPQLQNHPVGQQMGQSDQTIQTAPARMGHGQHQQQNWNPHAGQNQNGPATAPPPPDSSLNASQQNFGHAPIVRSLSGNGHADVISPGPTYNQVPMLHAQMTNQQHGQSVGQQGVDGQGAYGQAPMQHSQVPNQQQVQQGVGQMQVQPNQQPVHGGGQQAADGQSAYNQVQMQHAQAPNQQHVQTGGQQGVDGQGAYNQVQMQQHAQAPNQQHVQSGGQQGVDGQGAYNQVQMQQHPQVPSQQHVQNGGQQGVDGQGVYNQVQMQQHAQAPSQQQTQNGGQQGVDGQGAYNQVQMQQHAQSGGQQGVEGQGQAQTAFIHNPQNNQGMQQQDHVGQNDGQGGSGQVPAPAPYAHQSQNPNSVAPQGMSQGRQSQGPGGYQAAHLNELGGQSQFMQSSTDGMQQQSMQQNPNQPMHMMSQNGQNQGYGHATGQQQQHPQPVAQQPQHQPVQTAPPHNLQGSSHPSQQQHFMPNQQQVAQQHQNVHQVPTNVATQSIPAGSLSNPNANAEPGPSAPIQISTDPTVVDDAVAVKNPSLSKSLVKQSSSFSDDQVSSEDNHTNGVLGVPSVEVDSGNLHDEELASELRKLDEDFQKHMMRTQKVFDTRMDSLQRTQVQREALHQKTLEKHQKERADFEKRRHQEEIEQNRRIEQLQKDWERRREAMRQQQLEEAQAAESSSALSSSPPTNVGIEDTDGNSAQ